MAVGLVTGVLFAWGFGLLTERRLRTHGPELLDMMRTGRRPASAFGFMAMPEMSRRGKTMSMLCWSFGPIPLVPQGIVAGV
ncbi:MULTISPECIES: hypothetical protein [Nonomuraea]|uniref:Uncharacterized protein n=1 Tax=Nonomuraea mangrovi TaxID=2316207 RepID=A0ABW4TB94_9ACTN